MKKHLDTKRIAFVDLETTGLNPVYHEIIEICIITDDFTFTSKVKPEKLSHADKKSLFISGYQHRDWIEAPSFKAISPTIQRLTAGKMLCGHNVSFDYDFLHESLSLAGLPCLFNRRRIDTVNLAFEHLKPLGLTSFSLDSIRDFLGWSKVGANRAKKDCSDVKKLFHYLMCFGPLDRSLLRLRRRFGGYLVEGGAQ